MLPAAWLALSLMLGTTSASALPGDHSRYTKPETDIVRAERSPAAAANDFERELARVDDAIAATRKRMEAQPDSWLPWETLANNYLDRARLTGAVHDYRAADSSIAKAFTLSGEQSGPFLTRAGISLAVHRRDQALADLDTARKAILIDPKTRQRINGLNADALLRYGDVEQAASMFQQLERQKPSMLSAARLAHYHAAISDYDQASQWLAVAEGRVVGQSSYQLAWLKLQHGILALEQNHLDKALEHFKEADSTFGGYWLIEEHIAEVDTRQGRLEDAEVRYRDIVDRTQLPQMMTALAGVLEARDAGANATEAASLRQRAQLLFDDIAGDFPDFVTDHSF